ncbi:hypothetical protein PENSPDRAFT_685874 [Peniophora sp. CONT]|nr:hypothetical protein PENSPDRAFT_685874 [Peniophora sp. CONT]
MLAAVMLMYAAATISWAVSVASLIKVVERPEKYALLDAHSIRTEDLILLICQGLNFWLSDIIVAWRTWILWSDRSRAKWLVGGVPCALFVGVVVCGLVDLANFNDGAMTPIHSTTGPLGFHNTPSPSYATVSGKLGTIFSAILNVWCVLLAVAKSWQFGQSQKLAGRSLYDSRMGMMLTLVSVCGAIYCIFWIYWVAVGIRNVGPNLNATLLLCNSAAARPQCKST